MDGYLPISEYAALGDGRTIVLVGSDGSVDWMCLPDIDSPSVFGALLDAQRGGRFVLAPALPYTVSRAYLEGTNVLQTTFQTAEGAVRVTEAMTIDSSLTAPWRELARRVDGIAGSVPMVWHFEPRFDYGQCSPELSRMDQAVIARHGDLHLAVQSWNAGEGEIREGAVQGTFVLREGESALLAMQAADGDPLPLPERGSVERRLTETCDVWRTWISRQTYEGPWKESVERSLLAIRLLADGRTGAIAAAGTTSLPEVLGGERNYDYRFAWVRDLSFTLDALLSVGMEQLTQASISWLQQAVSRTHPRVDPVYSLDGTVLRSQEKLPLAGYRGTRPVHLGNNAGRQLQLGGFGDLLETIWRYVCHGHVLTPQAGERLADVADLLCLIWRSEDAGLWELGDEAHYTTSKVGCWLCLERVLDLADRGQVPARHPERWRSTRQDIRFFIESRLWSQERGSYLFKAGDQGLDCGTLLISRRGFDDPRGQRMNSTIDAIQRELHAAGPLYYRYSGMQEEENAFLACSFWMVEALAQAGRVDKAAELMDGMVGLSSDLGLYSEEMDPDTRELMGNLPQALTHLALINAAVAISNAGTPPADG